MTDFKAYFRLAELAKLLELHSKNKNNNKIIETLEVFTKIANDIKKNNKKENNNNEKVRK